MGGEWVSVFMCLKGLARDKELVLFCMILKGVGSVGAPLVRQTTSRSQEKYLIQGAGDLFNMKTLAMKEWRKVQLYVYICIKNPGRRHRN